MSAPNVTSPNGGPGDTESGGEGDRETRGWAESGTTKGHPNVDCEEGRVGGVPRGIFSKDITLDPMKDLDMTIRLEGMVTA